MLVSITNIVLSVCVIAALFPKTASAEVQLDRLQYADVFSIQYPVDARISPDGRTIIYVREFCDITTDRNYSNLWTVNFDGSGHRPLTSGNQNDVSPRWSPDGRRIAYLSNRDGKSQLYVRWMDTGQTAKITNLEFGPSGIAWSPNGNSIAFVSLVPVDPPRIGVVPTPSAGAKWEPPARIFDKLVYRSDGQGYLPSCSSQIFVVPADGGTPRQLTRGDHPLGAVQSYRGIQPVWSPDGQYLIFSANRRPDYEYEPLDSEVFELSLTDGSIKALTDRRGPDFSPAIAPDGKQIAYLGFDDKYQGYQVTHLYVMNRDGSGNRKLSTGLDRDVGSLRWDPDGRSLYFFYADQGDTKFGSYTLDGKLKTIAEHIGSRGVAHQSSGFAFGASYSVASNGDFVITYTRPNIPADIAVGSIRHPDLKVITSINEGLLNQRKLGQVEEIWYQSSLDGRKIQGWIIKPPDFDPSKKYPLILEIHGGPFADYGPRFDFEKQLMAAGGYVVLYTNPRGSTSYGEKFGNLIHHAYPGDDFYDLNSGVDAVIARGYIDPEGLYVTGGSGGGILTCWMIDRTTRFRAAASIYPVINWYSWTLTSDAAITGSKYWFPGKPEDYQEQFMKRSVLSYVNKVKTPTLLMVGEEDWRCPPTEAEQFYTALKLNKVETVLVEFPGESHGIRVFPSHWAQKVAYIVNWFDQHRKQP